MKQIGIYGAGGFGREVAWVIESLNKKTLEYELVGFIDDDEKLQGKILNGWPVYGLDQVRAKFPGISVVSGIGHPRPRRATMEKAMAIGLQATTVIHPNVEYSRWVHIGSGTIICPGCLLTTNIVLGKQVQINMDCTIGHDVELEDYVTLAPGVHISGYVKIRPLAYIGTGAVIINGTEDTPIIIGEEAIIGAGACVINSVPPGLTVVGLPAKPNRRKADRVRPKAKGATK